MAHLQKGHEAIQKSLLLFWTFAHSQILVFVPVISGTGTIVIQLQADVGMPGVWSGVGCTTRIHVWWLE